MAAHARWKNENGLTVLRNDSDAADADLRVNLIAVTGSAPSVGKILTSDATGIGTWQVNSAIQAAADAQTAANNAQTAANAAQAAADAANTAAAAAQAAADAALAGVAAAEVEIAANVVATTAAAAAATAAGVAAAAAGVAAAAAAASASAANTNAVNAQNTAELALPSTCSVMSDELIWTSGTPASAVSTIAPYNWVTFTATNGAFAYYWIDLKKGHWTFKFLTLNRNDCGRVSISIGATILVDPEDLYAAVTNNARLYTYVNVNIPDDGVHQLNFQINGKNASSSSYVFVPNKFWGYRTGA